MRVRSLLLALGCANAWIKCNCSRLIHAFSEHAASTTSLTSSKSAAARFRRKPTLTPGWCTTGLGQVLPLTAHVRSAALFAVAVRRRLDGPTPEALLVDPGMFGTMAGTMVGTMVGTIAGAMAKVWAQNTFP